MDRNSGGMCICSSSPYHHTFAAWTHGADRQCIDIARFEAFIQFNALISAIGPGSRDPAYSHLVKEAKHVRDLLRRLATPCPGDSRTYRTTVRNSVNMVALLLHANLSADYIILNSLLDGSPWGRPAAGGVRT